jgi:hypothetical protein
VGHDHGVEQKLTVLLTYGEFPVDLANSTRAQSLRTVQPENGCPAAKGVCAVYRSPKSGRRWATVNPAAAGKPPVLHMSR